MIGSITAGVLDHPSKFVLLPPSVLLRAALAPALLAPVRTKFKGHWHQHST